MDRPFSVKPKIATPSKHHYRKTEKGKKTTPYCDNGARLNNRSERNQFVQRFNFAKNRLEPIIVNMVENLATNTSDSRPNTLSKAQYDNALLTSRRIQQLEREMEANLFQDEFASNGDRNWREVPITENGMEKLVELYAALWKIVDKLEDSTECDELRESLEQCQIYVDKNKYNRHELHEDIMEDFSFDNNTIFRKNRFESPKRGMCSLDDVLETEEFDLDTFSGLQAEFPEICDEITSLYSTEDLSIEHSASAIGADELIPKPEWLFSPYYESDHALAEGEYLLRAVDSETWDYHPTDKKSDKKNKRSTPKDVPAYKRSPSLPSIQGTISEESVFKSSRGTSACTLNLVIEPTDRKVIRRQSRKHGDNEHTKHFSRGWRWGDRTFVVKMATSQENDQHPHLICVDSNTDVIMESSSTEIIQPVVEPSRSTRSAQMHKSAEYQQSHEAGVPESVVSKYEVDGEEEDKEEHSREHSIIAVVQVTEDEPPCEEGEVGEVKEHKPPCEEGEVGEVKEHKPPCEEGEVGEVKEHEPPCEDSEVMEGTNVPSVVWTPTRLRTCSSHEIAPSIYKKKLRRKNIYHPNQDIQEILREIGIDDLLLASKPAKCCRDAFLFERQNRSLPYAPSLRSLPLASDDVDIIKESVQMHKQNGKRSRSPELYNNSHEEMTYYTRVTNTNIRRDMFPWKIPVYEVRYFMHGRSDPPIDDYRLLPTIPEESIISGLMRESAMSIGCNMMDRSVANLLNDCESMQRDMQFLSQLRYSDSGFTSSTELSTVSHRDVDNEKMAFYTNILKDSWSSKAPSTIPVYQVWYFSLNVNTKPSSEDGSTSTQATSLTASSKSTNEVEVDSQSKYTLTSIAEVSCGSFENTDGNLYKIKKCKQSNSDSKSVFDSALYSTDGGTMKADCHKLIEKYCLPAVISTYTAFTKDQKEVIVEAANNMTYVVDKGDGRGNQGKGNIVITSNKMKEDLALPPGGKLVVVVKCSDDNKNVCEYSVKTDNAMLEFSNQVQANSTMVEPDNKLRVRVNGVPLDLELGEMENADIGKLMVCLKSQGDEDGLEILLQAPDPEDDMTAAAERSTKVVTDPTPPVVSRVPEKTTRGVGRMKVCSSMDVDVETLKSKMRKQGVRHSHRGMQLMLREVGCEKLLRASRPAKCCRKSALNEPTYRQLPYNISLVSLPLTPEDIKIINESYKMSVQRCKNSLDLKGEDKAKLAYYTNLASQSDNANINFPWVVPVYEIRYFQVSHFSQNGCQTDDTTTEVGTLTEPDDNCPTQNGEGSGSSYNIPHFLKKCARKLFKGNQFQGNTSRTNATTQKEANIFNNGGSLYKKQNEKVFGHNNNNNLSHSQVVQQQQGVPKLEGANEVQLEATLNSQYRSASLTTPKTVTSTLMTRNVQTVFDQTASSPPIDGDVKMDTNEDEGEHQQATSVTPAKSDSDSEASGADIDAEENDQADSNRPESLFGHGEEEEGKLNSETPALEQDPQTTSVIPADREDRVTDLHDETAQNEPTFDPESLVTDQQPQTTSTMPADQLTDSITPEHKASDSQNDYNRVFSPEYGLIEEKEVELDFHNLEEKPSVTSSSHPKPPTAMSANNRNSENMQDNTNASPPPPNMANRQAAVETKSNTTKDTTSSPTGTNNIDELAEPTNTNPDDNGDKPIQNEKISNEDDEKKKAIQPSQDPTVNSNHKKDSLSQTTSEHLTSNQNKDTQATQESDKQGIKQDKGIDASGKASTEKTLGTKCKAKCARNLEPVSQNKPKQPFSGGCRRGPRKSEATGAHKNNVPVNKLVSKETDTEDTEHEQSNKGIQAQYPPITDTANQTTNKCLAEKPEVPQKCQAKEKSCQKSLDQPDYHKCGCEESINKLIELLRDKQKPNIQASPGADDVPVRDVPNPSPTKEVAIYQTPTRDTADHLGNSKHMKCYQLTAADCNNKTQGKNLDDETAAKNEYNRCLAIAQMAFNQNVLPSAPPKKSRHCCCKCGKKKTNQKSARICPVCDKKYTDFIVYPAFVNPKLDILTTCKIKRKRSQGSGTPQISCENIAELSSLGFRSKKARLMSQESRGMVGSSNMQRKPMNPPDVLSRSLIQAAEKSVNTSQHSLLGRYNSSLLVDERCPKFYSDVNDLHGHPYTLGSVTDTIKCAKFTSQCTMTQTIFDKNHADGLRQRRSAVTGMSSNSGGLTNSSCSCASRLFSFVNACEMYQHTNNASRPKMTSRSTHIYVTTKTFPKECQCGHWLMNHNTSTPANSHTEFCNRRHPSSSIMSGNSLACNIGSFSKEMLKEQVVTDKGNRFNEVEFFRPYSLLQELENSLPNIHNTTFTKRPSMNFQHQQNSRNSSFRNINSPWARFRHSPKLCNECSHSNNQINHRNGTMARDSMRRYENVNTSITKYQRGGNVIKAEKCFSYCPYRRIGENINFEQAKMFKKRCARCNKTPWIHNSMKFPERINTTMNNDAIVHRPTTSTCTTASKIAKHSSEQLFRNMPFRNAIRRKLLNKCLSNPSYKSRSDSVMGSCTSPFGHNPQNTVFCYQNYKASDSKAHSQQNSAVSYGSTEASSENDCLIKIPCDERRDERAFSVTKPPGSKYICLLPNVDPFFLIMSNKKTMNEGDFTKKYQSKSNQIIENSEDTIGQNYSFFDSSEDTQSPKDLSDTVIRDPRIHQAEKLPAREFPSWGNNSKNSDFFEYMGNSVSSKGTVEDIFERIVSDISRNTSQSSELSSHTEDISTISVDDNITSIDKGVSNINQQKIYHNVTNSNRLASTAKVNENMIAHPGNVENMRNVEIQCYSKEDIDIDTREDLNYVWMRDSDQFRLKNLNTVWAFTKITADDKGDKHMEILQLSSKEPVYYKTQNDSKIVYF